MDSSTLTALFLGVALGAGGGLWLARVLARAGHAALTAERDLLRERVHDLESSTAADRELAATLSPLTATLRRVEEQVHVLERDRLTQFARLDEQLTAVQASGEALRKQTTALAGALRSSTARGDMLSAVIK